MEVIIEYDNGPCGSGKTTRCIDEMGSVPAKYIYAVDRKEVMAERAEKIAVAAARVGLRPHIRIIKSKRDRSDEGGTNTVLQDLSRVPRELEKDCHVIVIITHEAMKGADWGAFRDFHLIIDEVPNVWDHEECQTQAHYDHFVANYELTRLSDAPSFSEVTAIAAPAIEADVDDGDLATIPTVTLADYRQDRALSGWSVFHKRVTSDHGVFADIHDWREVRLKGEDGQSRRWKWYSIWDIHELAPVRRVWIVGNAFEHSVTFNLINNLFADPINPEHTITFVPLPTAETASEWSPRKVKIKFFAAHHEAGSNRWVDEKSPYRGHQHKWADWVAENTEEEGHFWSANMRHVSEWKAKIPGVAISPKCAGINDLRNFTKVSVCYSAKGSPSEIAALKLFGITPDIITRSREREDLIQIVFRSSLRLPADTRPVEVRVYDRAQAEFLARYFNTAGFPFAIELEHVDIGLDDVVVKTRKEKLHEAVVEKLQTEEERLEALEWLTLTPAQKAKVRRARAREAKIAAGEPVRSRGRPKKAD